MKTVYSIYHYGFSLLGALWYGFPSRNIRVIGVTGTKGKSTTLALLAHIFASAGLPVALCSSTNIRIGDSIKKNLTGNSMPGRMFLQRFLRDAVRAGCQYAFIEVTSQGIVQHRHRFISWDSAVFLGIHPEHIESHGSFEKYLSAKQSFFTYAARAHTATPTAFFSYGNDSHAQDFKKAADPHPVEFFFEAAVFENGVSVPKTLPGDFNRINISAAYSVAKHYGVPDGIIRSAIASFPGLVGRMTVVSENPIRAIVDYAHTPQSLEAVLKTVIQESPSSKSKLICLLGSCGGGRDVWKRPVLGGVAARYCSTIILTNEDPYDENPADILRDIRKGIEKTGFTGKVLEIEDRKDAIKTGVSLAEKGDALVCTGKGSEAWIHVAHGRKIPWDESAVVLSELQNKRI